MLAITGYEARLSGMPSSRVLSFSIVTVKWHEFWFCSLDLHHSRVARGEPVSSHRCCLIVQRSCGCAQRRIISHGRCLMLHRIPRKCVAPLLACLPQLTLFVLVPKYVYLFITACRLTPLQALSSALVAYHRYMETQWTL